MLPYNHISVVLPSYNGMPLIKESVNSILSQTFKNFYFVVCDDCSTDDTFEFLQSIKDNRVILLRNEKNLGLFPNLNKAIKASPEGLIHLWSQDDIMLSNCLEETIAFHNRYPKLAFAFSKCKTINGDGKIIREAVLTNNETISPQGHAITSLIAGSISGNIANVSMEKNSIVKNGMFNEQMKYSGDFDMWCKLSLENPVGLIQKHLILLRAHEGQLSRRPTMWIYRLKENYGIFDEFLKRVPLTKMKYIKRGMQWRVYTQYFNLLLKLITLRKFRNAYAYARELNRQSNLFSIVFKWFVLRVARLVKREKWIYKMMYYRYLS